MKIFEYNDYRKFLRARVRALPGHGRGELTRIARALQIHTTMMSHVMNGSAEFSLEQALRLADYLAFDALETDYLVALVQRERAGDRRTRAYCQTKLDELNRRARDVKIRIDARNEMNEADRAIYYSSPSYAHVRLLTAIPRFQTFEALAGETALTPKRLRMILDFLLSRGLCVEADGRIMFGDVPTYLESSSALVARHHLNWRAKVQDRLETLRDDDLAFTYPTVISEEDFLLIREKIVRLIAECRAIANPSPSNDLYCLNVDWLKLSRS